MVLKNTGDLINEYMDDGYTHDESMLMLNEQLNIWHETDDRDYLENYRLEYEQNNDFNIEDLIEMQERDDEFSRLFDVSCDFKGVDKIKEYEDNKIFIPTSGICLFKCVEKFLNKKLSLTKEELSISNTLTMIRKNLKKMKIELNSIPSFYKIDKRGKVITVDKKKQNKVGACIFLVNIKKYFYHAVLVKQEKITNEIIEHICKNLKIEKDKVLKHNCKKMDLPKFKGAKKTFYVYDIETSTKREIKIVKKNVEDKNEINEKKQKRKYNKENNIDEKIPKNTFIEKEEELKFLIPEGLGYMKVNVGVIPKTEEVVSCIGYDCFTQMLDQISKNEKENEILIFAHNGGRFDNIYVKQVKGVEILNQIKSGGSIKCLEIKYNKKIFKFMDSYAFLLDSLKNCCFTFKTELKTEFDIVDKDAEWFKNNKDWIPYMNQDVLVLGQILNKFEQYINKLNESITSTVGVASLAWRIICKSSYGMRNMFIATDPATQMFIKDSCYGGRILHYRKKFIAGETLIRNKTSKGLVSLDKNSLYPFGMFIGEYPIGKHTVIPEDILFEEFEEDYLLNDVLFIAEVEIDSRNSRYPLIPYRTEEKTLIYKSGVFRGVYNSVDLLEAINDGMKITKFYRGICWNKSARIFNDLVEWYYTKRAEFKAQKNEMQYIFKILLNAMYGKFLEKITSHFKFTYEKRKGKESVIHSFKLPNGQEELELKYETPLIKKPNQIASFILAYSRKSMNNLIREVGPEYVFYSDTDSLYMTIERAEKIKEGTKLGELKNDYGEGAVIKRAYFLDSKRYFLEFNKPIEGKMFKAKFNGLNFDIENKWLANWFEDNDINYIKKIRKIYKWFYNNPTKYSNNSMIQERWKREIDRVYISKKEIQFSANPNSRYDWHINRSYPKDYNRKNTAKCRTFLGRQTKFIEDRKFQFKCSEYELLSSLPLVCKELNVNFLSIKPSNLKTGFRSDYIITTNNNKIYKKEIKYIYEKNEKEEIIKKPISIFYEANGHGIVRLLSPDEQLELVKNGYNILIACRELDGPCPIISLKDLYIIKNRLLTISKLPELKKQFKEKSNFNFANYDFRKQEEEGPLENFDKLTLEEKGKLYNSMSIEQKLKYKKEKINEKNKDKILIKSIINGENETNINFQPISLHEQ